MQSCQGSLPSRKAIFRFLAGPVGCVFHSCCFPLLVSVAACPRCVSKWGRGSVFVCARRVFTRVMVAVLSSPLRVLGNGPCYFILGQCQLVSGSKDHTGQPSLSISQSWPEASMGEGKGESCEWAESLPSTLPTTAGGIMINTTLETRYNSTLCSSSEKQPDFSSLKVNS